MGCDGGTIPRRDELVRKRKKPEKKDEDANRQAKWKNCSLSQEALERPIMACQLGRLYNKVTVLEALVEGTAPPHLRGLRDLKELQLTENPAFQPGLVEKGDAYKDTQRSQYYCPVTNLEMNGKYKFCFIWGCGCVLSEKALKEVPSEVCHKCGKKFTEDEVITLNGSEEEVEALHQRMTAARELAKKAKKLKRKAEGGEEISNKTKPAENGASTSATKVDTSKNGTENGASTSATKVDTSKNGIEKGASTSATKADTSKNGIENGASTSATKADMSKNGGTSMLKKLGRDITSKTPANGDARKASSIQEDPKASKVYKSLFTTCDAAKQQPKAHWVTYNPCYN